MGPAAPAMPDALVKREPGCENHDAIMTLLIELRRGKGQRSPIELTVLDQPASYELPLAFDVRPALYRRWRIRPETAPSLQIWKETA
jgi:hypothetical protein